MSILNSLTKRFLLIFEPVVLRLARFYGIEARRHPGLNDSVLIHGKNKIIVHGTNKVFLDGEFDIPESVYFNTRSGNIYVGKNTLFGERVMLLTGKHLNIAEAEAQLRPLHYVPTEGRDIVIGEGCWIANGAIIMGGVKIGDCSVVGAGAVVTKDVPGRVLAAGVPARIIKHF